MIIAVFGVAWTSPAGDAGMPVKGVKIRHRIGVAA